MAAGAHAGVHGFQVPAHYGLTQREIGANRLQSGPRGVSDAMAPVVRLEVEPASCASFTGGTANIRSVSRHLITRDAAGTPPDLRRRGIRSLVDAIGSFCHRLGAGATDPSLSSAKHALHGLCATPPRGSPSKWASGVAPCGGGLPWSPTSRKDGGKNHRERDVSIFLMEGGRCPAHVVCPAS